MPPVARADLEVGLATRSDVPRILELSNRAAASTSANFATQPESIEQWMEAWQETSGRHPWLVARVAGEVVGFAKASPHRKREAYDWTAEVSVYIAPEHHGGGVGTALYGALIPLLRDQGFVLLLAGITDGHAASERLHARSGFARCGTFSRAGWKFGQWHDVGYWQLLLQPGDGPPRPIAPVIDVWRAPRQGRDPD